MLKHKAFTLLELLIARTITVIVLFGLLSLHAQSFKLSEITRDKSIALNAAH